MANILIIDDDPVLCAMLSGKVTQMGHEVVCALTLTEGVEKVRSTRFDVVFLDVRMPDGSGLNVLAQVKATPSAPEVIIMTGQGDPDGAELAIRNGAWDYIEKPSTMKQMVLPLTRALQYRGEKAVRKPPVVLKRDNIVGSSLQMRSCLDLLALAAGCDANVLITGETGTGKELFAQAIHKNSARAGQRFVVVDCAALPETLVESMLFGHEKGAFTGADNTQEGLIRQADGGTLFLDEVGELPLSIQKTFLRVLQEHRFRPIGGKGEVESHFRLISATNRDLDAMAEKGTFRKDLLFRLRAFPLALPPLREHREDIKELAIHHVARLCELYGLSMKGFSPDFLDVLSSYNWPGNVRELVNALERALSAAHYENILFGTHLPTEIRISMARSSFEKRVGSRGSSNGSAPSSRFSSMRMVREAAVAAAERGYLEELMSFTKGDITDACRISELSRPRLYALLKKYKPSR